MHQIIPIPGWLATFFLAMSPIFELRGAIPVAIGLYDMSPTEAYLISILGNLVPVILLLLYLEPVARYLMRYRIGEAFFTWLFTRTYRRYSETHRKYGQLALVLFVAIPLPVTGAWTGCAIAFLFGFKFRHAFPAIAAGVLLSGIIVTCTVMGVKVLIF